MNLRKCKANNCRAHRCIYVKSRGKVFFFVANGISGDYKCVAVLLSIIVLQELVNTVIPKKTGEKKYMKVVEEFKKHCDP